MDESRDKRKSHKKKHKKKQRETKGRKKKKSKRSRRCSSPTYSDYEPENPVLRRKDRHEENKKNGSSISNIDGSMRKEKEEILRQVKLLITIQITIKIKISEVKVGEHQLYAYMPTLISSRPQTIKYIFLIFAPHSQG